MPPLNTASFRGSLDIKQIAAAALSLNGFAIFAVDIHFAILDQSQTRQLAIVRRKYIKI